MEPDAKGRAELRARWAAVVDFYKEVCPQCAFMCSTTLYCLETKFDAVRMPGGFFIAPPLDQSADAAGETTLSFLV